MARPRKKDAPPVVQKPPPAPWASEQATYLRGRSMVDGVDHLACELERKWGVDRLRLLVTDDMRERFDRQRAKFGRAVREGTLEDVTREAPRMRAAWLALDGAAIESGESPVSPNVWEVALPTGEVATLCRTREEAQRVVADGRSKQVYTIEEIANLIHAVPQVIKAKEVFPGAAVVAARRPDDPTFAMDVDWKEGDEVPF